MRAGYFLKENNEEGKVTFSQVYRCNVKGWESIFFNRRRAISLI